MMKKVFFGIICLISMITNVQAVADFTWHNSAEDAYTTDYSGTINGSDTGTYQNGSISSSGNYTIKMNNFKAYDIMMFKAYIISLNGTSTVEYIEQSLNSSITLTGNGSLKVKEVGLSMEDMISPNTNDYQNQVKKYVKGDYTLKVESGYLIFTTKETPNNNSSQNTSPTQSNTNTNSNKVPTTNQPEQETSTEQKALSFTDSKTGVSVKGNATVDKDITFSAQEVTEQNKEGVNELINEEIYKIYEFEFKKNNKVVVLEKEMEISLKIDPNNSYKVYYYSDNGLLKLESNQNDDILTFKTNHFSKYVLTISKDQNEPTENKSPKEEENNDQRIFIVIGTVALIGIISILVVKSNKKK